MMVDTISTMFLLPGLGLKLEEIRFRFGFINAYIKDDDHEPHDRGVYLLFKPDDLIEFEHFVQREKKRTPQLIEDYDYRGGYVVLLYIFPEEYLHEWKLFIKGKYSKFRDKYKVLLPDVESKIDSEGMPFTEMSLQCMIVFKAPALKQYLEEKFGEELEEDAEYWTKPSTKKETLNITKIIQS